MQLAALTIRDVVDYATMHDLWNSGARLVLEFSDFKWEWVSDIFVNNKQIILRPIEHGRNNIFTLADIYTIILNEDLINDQILVCGSRKIPITDLFLSQDLYLVVGRR